jgi:D-inositol-3-phosphate glycosyltransferase
MTVLTASWPRPKRVAVLSVHTSPLDQPGTGDAGGMNVYVVEVSRRLAAAGVEVDIFTRATSSDLPSVVELTPGVTVRHVTAGPLEGLRKEDLPAQLCAVSGGVLRAEAQRDPGWYDLVHSHYWLSGQVGWLAAERWGTPLIHTMHTMAKVKNLELAEGDSREPQARVIGEQQVVDFASRLVANTDVEAEQLRTLYDADPARIAVVHPGVDLDLFKPSDPLAARARLGVPAGATLLLFVGRLQPLKAPDVLLKATAELLRRAPEMRRSLLVAICGGPSGSGLDHPEALADLAHELGISDVVRFVSPVGRETLADWYRSATVTVVPSHSESFGLVAVASQACGTPVVAAAVGGLPTAVADERSGLLVVGHEPGDWAAALARATEPTRRAELARGAVEHAQSFSWSATAAATLDVYASALAEARVGAPRLVAGS